MRVVPTEAGLESSLEFLWPAMELQGVKGGGVLGARPSCPSGASGLTLPVVSLLSLSVTPEGTSDVQGVSVISWRKPNTVCGKAAQAISRVSAPKGGRKGEVKEEMAASKSPLIWDSEPGVPEPTRRLAMVSWVFEYQEKAVVEVSVSVHYQIIG